MRWRPRRVRRRPVCPSGGWGSSPSPINGRTFPDRPGHVRGDDPGPNLINMDAILRKPRREERREHRKRGFGHAIIAAVDRRRVGADRRDRHDLGSSRRGALVAPAACCCSIIQRATLCVRKYGPLTLISMSRSKLASSASRMSARWSGATPALFTSRSMRPNVSRVNSTRAPRAPCRQCPPGNYSARMRWPAVSAAVTQSATVCAAAAAFVA